MLLAQPASQGRKGLLATAAHLPASQPSRPARSLPLARALQHTSTADWLGMAAGFLLILAVTVINSRGRIFWEDEVLAWVLLRDPSWHHMIHAWKLGADGGGFTFYVLGRLWFRVFGSSELAFRLFSSTCFGLAFVVLWKLLRRFYSLPIVAFAAFNTMFFSPPLTMHYVEGRFYGLLVLNTALAFWLAVNSASASRPVSRLGYALVFVVHSLLTTSHVLGIVYSAAFVAAMVILDRLQGRWRAGLYLSAAAAWLWLIPEKAALLATSQVGKPYFWTKAPKLGQVIGAFTGSSLEILALLLLLSLGVSLTLPRSAAALRTRVADTVRRRQALYVTTGCLLFVPVLFLLQGLIGPWLFVDRYLQPVTLAVAAVTAELVFLLLQGSPVGQLRLRAPRIFAACLAGAGAVFSLCMGLWVFGHMASYTPSVPDYTRQLTAQLPHDLPVVVGDAFTFTELMSRQADSGVPFTFLLDWNYTLSPAAPRLEVTQYHLMENWKRAGIFADHIDYSSPFLRAHDKFLVIDNTPLGPTSNKRPEWSNPIAERLAQQPGYQVSRYTTLDRTYKDSQRDVVWLVCRHSCTR